MLNLTFIVFTDTAQLDTTLETAIIRRLEEKGFNPLVDGKNKTSKQWFNQNCQHSHLLFLNNGDSFVYDPTKPAHAPVLGVFVNESIGLEDDTILNAWVLKYVFNQDIPDSTDLDDFDKSIVRPQKSLPKKQVEEAKEPNEQKNTQYSFTMKYQEYDGSMLYQVIKPHTDRPYTTITRNFADRGHLPFFSSLFICHSWGTCDKDIIFLSKLWKHLEMKGEFNINKIVDDRIEACTPAPNRFPEAEPEVWRNSIDAVSDLLKERFDLTLKGTRLIE